jgi:hypothetical protein
MSVIGSKHCGESRPRQIPLARESMLDSDSRGAGRRTVAFHSPPECLCPALVASAVAVEIMTNELGPPAQQPQTEPAADTDQAAGSQITDAAQLGARSEYAVLLDMLSGRKSPESAALHKAAAEHVAALVKQLTPEEYAALNNCFAGAGTPLDAAKVLRHRPELLETWHLSDTEFVRKVRGLVQLSNPDAFALVENGKVPIDQAALVGRCVRNVFAHHHSPQVVEDFQMRAMTRLAEGKPVSAERTKYFANPIEEVANDVLNEQNAERRRLDCERIWKEPYWSVWPVLSWIAFRHVARLCEIEDERSFTRMKLYGAKHYGPFLKEAKPEPLLLSALKSNELRAIRSGAELQAIYWADKNSVDRNTGFRQRSVRRCWPGLGEWNGFQDEFWSLGQIILWIVTRDPDDVDRASDDAGRVGARIGYGGFAAAVRLAELLREQREQVEDAANDLRRRCLRGELNPSSGQHPIPAIAWTELKIGFEADGVPFVQRIEQRSRDPAYNNIRFLRAEALGVFKPAKTPEEFNLLRQMRTRRASEFNRKQNCIALGKRRWLRLTEIARECARKPESLGEIDDTKRKLALDELRYSILTGEFVDHQSRSRVLNMHPSPVANFRFEPPGASRPELFEPIAEHLWITYQDCVDWFSRREVPLPLRLRREASSASPPEAARADIEPRAPAKRSEPVKKSDEERKANALKIAWTFVGKGVAPNLKTHTTLVMGALRALPVEYRMLRKDVEGLLKTEFTAARRAQGNPRSK